MEEREGRSELLTEQTLRGLLPRGPDDAPQEGRGQEVEPALHFHDHLQQDLAGEVHLGLGVHDLDVLTGADDHCEILQVHVPGTPRVVEAAVAVLADQDHARR